MYNFFKNFDDGNSCQSSGICTTDLRLSSLEELLMNELRQISFYVVKAREHGQENSKIASDAVCALAISLLNTNFNELDYFRLYKNLYEDKKTAREMFVNAHKNELVVNIPLGAKIKDSIVDMMREGEGIVRTRQRNIPEGKKGLFALIFILVKTASRNVLRIKSFEPNFCEYDFEILRLFSLTTSAATRDEKLVRRIKEFLGVSGAILSKLTSVLQENYGEPTSARVRTTVKAGKAILVDGLNLKELQIILETIGDRDINVYTHNILFVAHHFPRLRAYKNLAGHWGSPNTEYDFSTFPGAIFLGKSFFQKIDSVCRGVIFSNAIVNLKGATKIHKNNFEPLIQAALAQEGFHQDQEEYFEDVKYDKQEIERTIESTLARNITVIVGKYDGEQECETLGNSQVISIGSPIELELLDVIASKARERNLAVRFFFAQCSAQVVAVGLVLKHIFSEVSIFVSKCPTLMVNPRVVKVLEKDFDFRVL